MRSILVRCWPAAALLFQAAGPLAAQGAGTLVVEPARAETGVFYRGVRLAISGVVDSGDEVAVLVTGPSRDLLLHVKQRIAGAFWAPSGEAEFRAVPTVYLLHTSARLGARVPEATLGSLGIGYGALRTMVAPERAELFLELVRLKESEGLFRVAEGEVDVAPEAGGRQRVTALVELPANAPAATYLVQLFAFRDQQLRSNARARFTLTAGWVPAFIGGLAERHGALYGGLAVVGAVVAGLLIGLVATWIKAT